jgi:hypothetical protein
MSASDQDHDNCLECGGVVRAGGQAVGMMSPLGKQWVYWLCQGCYAAEVKQQEAMSPALADDGHKVAIAMWARVTGWSDLPKMHERHPAPRNQ